MDKENNIVDLNEFRKRPLKLGNNSNTESHVKDSVHSVINNGISEETRKLFQIRAINLIKGVSICLEKDFEGDIGKNNKLDLIISIQAIHKFAQIEGLSNEVRLQFFKYISNEIVKQLSEEKLRKMEKVLKECSSLVKEFNEYLEMKSLIRQATSFLAVVDECLEKGSEDIFEEAVILISIYIKEPKSSAKFLKILSAKINERPIEERKKINEVLSRISLEKIKEVLGK
ncbi:hypothetical protein CSA08_03410 [Candidatus Gracilibacteria bacterium]|nr:MAG: hypothetical protein CSA08_03410 [Candidatus Gracilibacteria bacterium]